MSTTYSDLPLSTFPESEGTWINMQDLNASDISLMKTYQQYINNGDISNAQIFLNNNPTLATKILNAVKINTIGQDVQAIKRMWNGQVQGYIEIKQAELTTSQTNALNSIQTSKDSALISIENKKDNIIAYMDSTTAGAIRNDMGVMGDLETTDKSSLVDAINEVKSNIPNVSAINTKIGSDTLTTTAQNLSGATNEVNNKISNLLNQNRTLSMGGMI